MTSHSIRILYTCLYAAAWTVAVPAYGADPSPTRDPCAASATADPTPRGSAARLAGDQTEYRPVAATAFGRRCMTLEAPISMTGRVEDVSRFAVDRYGNTFGGVSLSPQVRLGARFFSGLEWSPIAVLAEAELDAPTGYVRQDPDLPGDGFPADGGLELQLRKLHVRGSLGRTVHLDLGVQTSHFGMGLVANDGAHGWEPGSASFGDPRGGDRVLRAQISTGPHTALSLAVSLGADQVLGDDVLLEHDSAHQVFGAILAGVGKPFSGGAYVARRHQESAAGSATDVTILDLTSKSRTAVSGAVLSLETEWALVLGKTQLVHHPESGTENLAR